MSGTRQYTGIRDCFRQSYKAEGLAFLTRGMCSTLLRAFFINAACFFVVSWTLKIFDRRTTVQVELPKDDHITISSGSPLQSLVIPIITHRDDAYHYKTNVVKSLVYANVCALSDAMCSADFVDLANELCDDDGNDYCNYNVDRLIDFPSVTGLDNTTSCSTEIVLSD